MKKNSFEREQIPFEKKIISFKNYEKNLFNTNFIPKKSKILTWLPQRPLPFFKHFSKNSIFSK